MGIEWPFRHLIALRPRELPILLKREFMHRRILSPAVELLHHPTQTAAPEHAIASAAPAASSKSPYHSSGAVQSSSSNHSISDQRSSGTCAVKRRARSATLISAAHLDCPLW